MQSHLAGFSPSRLQEAMAAHVRHSHSLCADEEEYVQSRKQVVLDSLRRLDIDCPPTSVPHIAFLASGGGQRSAVGLVGSLYQMEKDGLVDTLLYLGGVSGSTWAMASLYSDPQWSSNMDAAVSRLSVEGVYLEQALSWLSERAKEEHFSLSDVWGVLTSAGIMKQMDLRHLSDEASRNATNPYPIYSAIEKQCFAEGSVGGRWFEMSPHESGFTEMGLFVNTSLLGSKFKSGELLETKPEMDMVKLQGLLGCALAHEEMVREVIPPWMNTPEYLDSAALEYLRLYNALDQLLSLTRTTVEDPTALADLSQLQKILKDKIHYNVSPLLQSKTSEDRKEFFQQQGADLLSAFETWSQNLNDGPFKTHASMLTKQVIPLLLKWEWGTTGNFLYQYKDTSVPACLLSTDKMYLVDAGLLINVGYPPFLGDKRDIDLIIAPEYSAGNMFETMTLARDYAAEVNKPFPKIDEKILEDKDLPESCYVIEGKEKEPSIIYMPLFNRQNCKDAKEFQAKMEEFSTFQGPFSQDKIDSVLEISKANMKNNRETLLREIKKAALRRQTKN
uniref:PLA2c domain-containing protein n=1 Tax=Gouania willdenowi TaxID=441366 RepID=A0A8C5DJ79_GOUWI